MEVEQINPILIKNLERLFIVEYIYWPLFKEINPKYLMLSVSLELLINKAKSKGCIISRTRRPDMEIDNKEIAHKNDGIRRLKINKQPAEYNIIYTNEEIITIHVPRNIVDTYHSSIYNSSETIISATSNELKVLLLNINNKDQNSSQELIEIYFPEILKIAKEYIEFEVDAIQEGLNGFLRSCTIYDVTKDGQFVDYANKWIRSFIDQAIAESRRLT